MTTFFAIIISLMGLATLFIAGKLGIMGWPYKGRKDFLYADGAFTGLGAVLLGVAYWIAV